MNIMFNEILERVSLFSTVWIITKFTYLGNGKKNIVMVVGR